VLTRFVQAALQAALNSVVDAVELRAGAFGHAINLRVRIREHEAAGLREENSVTVENVTEAGTRNDRRLERMRHERRR
jgi:hypothetical protein